MRRALALVVTLELVAAGASAQAPPLRPSAPSALTNPLVLPLTRGPGRLRRLQVRIGADTADYLFDTGGGVTAISPGDSAALGCLPGGKDVGVRLTGEQLSGRICANVSIGVGLLRVTTDAGVMDLARLLGPKGPPVRGLASLETMRGHLLTLDLAHDRLIVETPASFAARARGMTPLAVHTATGEDGRHLEMFVGVTTPSGAALWFEWDSGNTGATLIAPYAAAMLGGDSVSARSDLRVPLAAGLTVTMPVRLKKDMVLDGVIGAGVIERALWAVDLEHGRMWVGPVEPILESPTSPATTAPRPPREDPVGLYETVADVGGTPRRAIVEIARQDGRLVGRSRALGEDDVVQLGDIALSGDDLTFRPVVPDAFQVQLTFNGLRASGTWGDGGVKRGGRMTAVKVR